MEELAKYKIGTKDNLLKIIPSLADNDKLIVGHSPIVIYGKGYDSFSINPDDDPDIMVCSNSSNVIAIHKFRAPKFGGVLIIHDRLNIPFSVCTPNGVCVTAPKDSIIIVRALERMNKFTLIGANSIHMEEVENSLQTMANLSEDKGMELAMSFIEFSITYDAIL